MSPLDERAQSFGWVVNVICAKYNFFFTCDGKLTLSLQSLSPLSHPYLRVFRSYLSNAFTSLILPWASRSRYPAIGRLFSRTSGEEKHRLLSVGGLRLHLWLICASCSQLTCYRAGLYNLPFFTLYPLAKHACTLLECAATLLCACTPFIATD